MNPYILLVKQAIENYVKEKKVIELPADLPEEFLKRKAGVFVTIEKNLDGLPDNQTKIVLRGCIGTYLPTKENIAEEIIANALAAATEDYRFGPIQKDELPRLFYTVYILSKPKLVKNIKELNPKKYGIITKTVPIPCLNGSTGSLRKEIDVVFNGHLPFKSGLLLPDLKGIETVEQQISIACQKGGINPVKEKIIIYRFIAEKYQ